MIWSVRLILRVAMVSYFQVFGTMMTKVFGKEVTNRTEAQFNLKWGGRRALTTDHTIWFNHKITAVRMIGVGFTAHKEALPGIRWKAEELPKKLRQSKGKAFWLALTYFVSFIFLFFLEDLRKGIVITFRGK